MQSTLECRMKPGAAAAQHAENAAPETQARGKIFARHRVNTDAKHATVLLSQAVAVFRLGVARVVRTAGADHADERLQPIKRPGPWAT